MTRRRPLVAVLALALVVGLALAAATLDTATFATGDGPAGPVTPPDGPAGESGSTLLVLLYWLVVLFALFGLAMAVRSGQGSPASVAAVGAAIVVGGLIVYVILVASGTMEMPPDPVSGEIFERIGTDSTAADGRGQPSDTGEGSTGSSPFVPVAVVLALAGVVGAGAIAVTRFRRAAGDGVQPSGRAGDADADAAAVGRAAGRVADELDAAAIENPVYRAWHEMTAALDVAHPETTTPAAFGDAAVAAGLDPADVRPLTDVFREVRYGDAAVTEARADRARAALRRIEATYADDRERESARGNGRSGGRSR